jgi:S-DNA-T family DNA segregation ATPase FtsK/SpoIIIE
MALIHFTGPIPSGVGPGRLRAWRDRRQAVVAAHQEAQRLANAWAQTAYLAGLGEETTSAIGVSGTRIPQVTVVNMDRGHLLVRLLPGQLPADLVKVADRLAYGLRVARVRIVPRVHGYVRVELHRVDPLPDVVAWPGYVGSAADLVLLGVTEQGERLQTSLERCGHIAVQGQSQSGKSTWCYSLLAQAAACPDLEIVGSDVSGLLLRPWDGAADVALGTADLGAHLDVLERQVQEMDRRLAGLPRRVDRVPLGQACPLRLVVLEEFPGLIRAAGLAAAGSKTKMVDQIKSHVARLVSEGHKAGFRVLLVAQRMDTTWLGGYERAQLHLRISFAADVDALKMLHPDVDQALAAHALSAPGIALVSGPQLPLIRLRGPQLPGGYAAFVDAVDGVSRAC